MRYIFTLLFSSLYIISFSQGPGKEWARCYGTDGLDSFGAIEATPDSGYILAGRSELSGDVQFSIVKTDRLGNIQWEKYYGGSHADAAIDITAAHNGGYIVVGFSLSDNGNLDINYGEEDFWILRLDANGNMLWNKVYGGSESDLAMQVTKTDDGNYVVAGITLSSDIISGYMGEFDYSIIKLDDSGNILWEKILGGSGADYGPMMMKETPDHHLFLLGFTTSADGDVSVNQGQWDIWLVKLDASGNLVWQKTYGGSGSDTGFDMLLLEDGGIAVLGQTNSADGDISSLGTNGGEDFWLLRLDANGNKLWDQVYGGNGLEEARTLLRVPSGNGYLLLGDSWSNNFIDNYGYADFLVIRVDTGGTTEWVQHWGGADSDDMTAGGVNTWDGQYALAGTTYSAVLSSPDIDVAGNHGYGDGWLIKLGEKFNIEENSNYNAVMYPNPADEKCYVQISGQCTGCTLYLLDVTGKTILQKPVAPGITPINLQELAAGAYPWRISNAEGKKAIGKLIVK